MEATLTPRCTTSVVHHIATVMSIKRGSCPNTTHHLSATPSRPEELARPYAPEETPPSGTIRPADQLAADNR